MADSIRDTLKSNIPKTAFATCVMAALPSSAHATFAAGTTATAIKLTSAWGSTATSAFGGAVLGSLLGIAGGILGTWMSWRNCDYESQQKFILRQALLFVALLSVLAILLAVLVTMRVQAMIPNNTLYATLLLGLLLGFQAINLVWILRGNRQYKKIAEEAKLRGEPLRPSAQAQLNMLKEQSQVIHADGRITYEAFRWNASAWFGSCFGACAWMVPLSAAAFIYGASSMAIVTCLSCCLVAAFALIAWHMRERLDAYLAVQILVVVAFLTTINVFISLQFLSNPATRAFAQWSPWVWCLLLLFPLISFKFWWMRRSFGRGMVNRQIDVNQRN